MSRKILNVLVLAGAAVLEAEQGLASGMRDELKVGLLPPKGIPSGQVTYKISETERNDCVLLSSVVGDRNLPLLDGAPCSGQGYTEEQCGRAYEHKSRHDHIQGNTEKSHATWTAAYSGRSLKGEVHLCKWNENLAGHQCEAAEVFAVCPAELDGHVVQVTSAGTDAGDAQETGTLPHQKSGVPAAIQLITASTTTASTTSGVATCTGGVPGKNVIVDCEASTDCESSYVKTDGGGPLMGSTTFTECRADAGGCTSIAGAIHSFTAEECSAA